MGASFFEHSLIANLLIRLLGLQGRAHVCFGNLYDFDLTGADTVTLYLLQGTNQRIKSRLSEQLRPGAKVVSHSFSMSNWAPVALDDDKGIFMYEIGNTDSNVQTRFV
jgi:hypothetical protein